MKTKIWFYYYDDDDDDDDDDDYYYYYFNTRNVSFVILSGLLPIGSYCIELVPTS